MKTNTVSTPTTTTTTPKAKLEELRAAMKAIKEEEKKAREAAKASKAADSVVTVDKYLKIANERVARLTEKLARAKAWKEELEGRRRDLTKAKAA